LALCGLVLPVLGAIALERKEGINQSVELVVIRRFGKFIQLRPLASRGRKLLSNNSWIHRAHNTKHKYIYLCMWNRK